MKTCFKSSELPHVYVYQQAPEGRVSSGNISFQGDEYRSYSTVICRRLAPEVYLMDKCAVSHTTAGHMCALRKAIPNSYDIIKVMSGVQGQCLDWTPKEIGVYLIDNMEEKLSICQLTKPNAYRQFEAAYQEAMGDLLGLNTLRDKLKLKDKKIEKRKLQLLQVVDNLDEKRKLIAAKQEAVREANNIRYARQREEQRILNLKYLEEQKDKLNEWLAGGQSYLSSFNNPAYLRLSPEDNIKTQTSAGVTVPTAVVLRTIERWFSNTLTPGHLEHTYFTITHVEQDMVTIGCHTFMRSEAERFLKVICDKC